MDCDGFFTTCTTCAARLKVRDQAAIGQIFACPKCGSMVMVDAPADDSATSEEMPEPADAEGKASVAGWLGGVGAVAASILLTAGIFIAWPPTDGPGTWTISPSEEANQEVAEAKPPPVADVTLAQPAPETQPELASDDVLLYPTDDALELVPVDRDDDRFEQTASDALPTQTFDESITPANFRTPQTSEQPNSANLSSLAHLLSGSVERDEQVTDSDVAPEPTEIAGATLGTKTGQSQATPHSDIRSQVDRSIRAVRFDNVPLVDFLRSMTQLSGVPIQVDPDALQQTGNTARTPVSVVAIDAPISEILRLALEPIRMIYVVESTGVRVTSSRLEEPRTITATFFVGDLYDREETDLDLVTLVATLVAPESWSAAGGPGEIEYKSDKLYISNHRLVAIKTVVFLEKLRAARGLRPRQKVPPHLRTLDPRWVQVDRFLRRPINLDIWQEARLSDIAYQLEQASGLTVLVDWASLIRVGLRPDSMMTLHARSLPAADAFQRLAAAHGLSLIPIDERTVQLTTANSLSSKRYLEFYSFLQLGSSGMEFVEQLMLDGTAALDTVSEVAFVLGDAELHRALAN